MLITTNSSLKLFNTFGIDAIAKYFTSVNSIQNIEELLKSNEYKTNEHLIIGGGSNLLFTKNVNALVIKNDLKGIELVKETEDFIFVKCAAGEVWHEFVLWCINKNYGGLENLSLIDMVARNAKQM